MSTVLLMEGIDKSFGGVHALKGVDFELEAGEVHALVGQNGAGKSTLIKILSGALTPDAGTIRIDGQVATLSSPADGLRLGIGTVYQDPLVYPELTVTENIFMGRELRDRFGNIDTRAQVARVRSLLHDLEVDPGLATRPMGGLSVALRQLALIAPRMAEPVLAVRGLTHRGMYQDVSFELRPGEIVGFFGLVGAGRSEVARAIFGEEPAEQGEILVNGRTVRRHSPAQALRLGIAYLPEDRKGQGLFGNLSVAYNVAITSMRRLAALGWLVRPGKEEALAQRYVRDLSIKTPSTRVKVANLSGGNQQKVVLAKWLAAQPRIFILDEPTAGIDVSSKQEIHNLIAGLAREGVAIMLISSELPEILKLSDRVITMHEGHLTGDFTRDAAPNVVLAAAMGEGARRAQPATA